jgi:mono/diheme cytochrome c family protein
MKRLLAWAAILLCPVLILGGLWSTRRDPARPNWVIPTQMAHSPAYAAQSANPVLPGGFTAQPPVEGTLARGAHAFHYAATDADRRRAGIELTNPIPATPELLAEGKRLYETYCLVCHGSSGAGDGPIIPKFPNPPGFKSKQTRKLNDGEIFHTITLGRKKMAGHGGLLTWDERWKVIHYLRSLQQEKAR